MSDLDMDVDIDVRVLGGRSVVTAPHGQPVLGHHLSVHLAHQGDDARRGMEAEHAPDVTWKGQEGSRNVW